MKIAIVMEGWGGYNGGVFATTRLVRELLARGHEIRIVTTGRHENEEHLEFYEVEGFAPGPTKEALKEMNFLFGKGDKEVMRRAFQGVDLVQIQFPFFMPPAAVKVAKELDIPVIGATHVQPQNVLIAIGKYNRVYERILGWLFNFSLFNRVSAVHCVSNFAAQWLLKTGVKAHLRVISNGIPRQYVPRRMERPGWFKDRFVVLNVGRHVADKRQRIMIEGVARSKYSDRIQLILAGKGQDTQELRRLGQKLPVKPLIDYISEEDKLLYLNTADLYLHASIVELESLACLEAIGSGLPVLIGDSKLSAATQFAVDERFIFEFDNPTDLARKLDYLYEHREVIREARKKSLEMAHKFRMDYVIHEMEKLYMDVIEAHKSGISLPPGIFNTQDDEYFQQSNQWKDAGSIVE